MSNQYLISVSFDGQPEVQFMPLDSNEPGLGLSTNGITWCEQSDAQIYIDDHNELMIKCMNSMLISIERCGRKSILKTGHPLCIMPKDIITIGETTPHTFHIHHIYRSHKPLNLSIRLSKLAMIACATSMVMTCNIACHRPEPNNPTDAIQTSTTSDSSESTESSKATETSTPSESELDEVEDVQLDAPMLMGLVVRPDDEPFVKDKDNFVDEMKSHTVDCE